MQHDGLEVTSCHSWGDEFGAFLKGRDGDRINAVLAAAGYNFALLLRWLARLLRALFQALSNAFPIARLA